MSKFIKLTNAVKELEGDPVILNREAVISVFSHKITEDDQDRTVTMVFVPPHGTWQVQETVEEVYQLLGN